jgi:hypothetical protein
MSGHLHCRPRSGLQNPACQAANACLAAPLLIFGLAFCLSTLTQNHRDASNRPLLLGFSFVAAGILFVGVIAGILAIALAKAGQRSSVLVRAGCGLLLMGLLAAIAVPNFVRARTLALQNKQALSELHAAAADLRAQTAASLTNGEGGAVDARHLQWSLKRAAERSSGETAALLRGSQAFVTHLQSYQQAYERAAGELLAAKVLAASTLQQRAQIEDRKALVHNFVDANDAFKTFLQESESNYGKEFAALDVSSSQTEAAIAGFKKAWAAQRPLLVKIREADDQMGRAMLGVLDLFNSQWGKWRYDAAASLVRFQDRTALDQYKALMAEIKQGRTDQAAAQKDLLAVMSQPRQAL